MNGFTIKCCPTDVNNDTDFRVLGNWGVGLSSIMRIPGAHVIYKLRIFITDDIPPDDDGTSAAAMLNARLYIEFFHLVLMLLNAFSSIGHYSKWLTKCPEISCRY